VDVGVILWLALTGVSFGILGLGALNMIAWSSRQRRR